MATLAIHSLRRAGDKALPEGGFPIESLRGRGSLGSPFLPEPVPRHGQGNGEGAEEEARDAEEEDAADEAREHEDGGEECLPPHEDGPEGDFGEDGHPDIADQEDEKEAPQVPDGHGVEEEDHHGDGSPEDGHELAEGGDEGEVEDMAMAKDPEEGDGDAEGDGHDEEVDHDDRVEGIHGNGGKVRVDGHPCRRDPRKHCPDELFTFPQGEGKGEEEDGDPRGEEYRCKGEPVPEAGNGMDGTFDPGDGCTDRLLRDTHEGELGREGLEPACDLTQDLLIRGEVLLHRLYGDEDARGEEKEQGKGDDEGREPPGHPLLQLVLEGGSHHSHREPEGDHIQPLPESGKQGCRCDHKHQNEDLLQAPALHNSSGECIS